MKNYFNVFIENRGGVVIIVRKDYFFCRDLLVVFYFLFCKLWFKEVVD